MSPTPTPPGWYPDPGDPDGSLRWWGGAQWTGHVHARPAPAADATSFGSGRQTAAPSASAAGWAGPDPLGTPSPSDYRTPVGWGGGTPIGRAPIDLGSAGASGGGSVYHRNRQSFAAIALAVIYIALSLISHVTLFGILPILIATRALRSKEQLAPVAMAASILVAVLGFAVLAHI